MGVWLKQCKFMGNGLCSAIYGVVPLRGRLAAASFGLLNKNLDTLDS